VLPNHYVLAVFQNDASQITVGRGFDVEYRPTFAHTVKRMPSMMLQHKTLVDLRIPGSNNALMKKSKSPELFENNISK